MYEAMSHEKKDPKSLIKKLFQSDGGSKQKSPSFQYIFIIISIGVVLMLLGNVVAPEKSVQQDTQPAMSDGQKEKSQDVFKKKDASSPSSMTEYAEYYENQLREVLENISGVGEVSVIVTMGSTEKIIVGKNTNVQSENTTENDREGGTREIQQQSRDENPVIIGSGEGSKPLIIGKQKPDISGVGVVAEGADNVQVKAWIKDTVSRALGVPTHQVIVTPKKTKGE